MGNASKQARIYIGTSGWHYKHWRGNFYPARSSTKDWLDLYTNSFNTVELNNVFYRFPTEKAVEQWARAVPDGFLFAVKASRYLTHRKKLMDPQEPLNNLLDRIGHLGARLGPLLFQLPPRWRANPERIAAFIEYLPRERPDIVFEFRDSSWYSSEILQLLSKHKLNLCLHDWPGAHPPLMITGNIAYLRFHGPEKAYAGKYSQSQLRPWIERVCTWRSQVERIFVYFNNDQNAFAVQNALELKAALEEGTEARAA